MNINKLASLRILAVLLLLASYGCTDKGTEFIDGNQLKFDENLDFLTYNFTMSSSTPYRFGPAETDIMPINIPQTRYDLTDMRSVVKVFDGTKNAGLTIPGFGGLTLGEKESNVNVYYIETKVVNDTVYGIGYSVHYLFKKVKRGLNLNNLKSISASVQLESNKTQVMYSLQTYGIIGTNLVRYFKPSVNKNFDVEGYGLLQSYIDGIHNVLSDTLLSKAVKFTPEIIKFVKPSDLN